MKAVGKFSIPWNRLGSIGIMSSLKVQFLDEVIEVYCFVFLFCFVLWLIFDTFFVLGNGPIQALSTEINMVSCTFLKLSINLGFHIFVQNCTKYFLMIFSVFCLPFALSYLAYLHFSLITVFS